MREQISPANKRYYTKLTYEILDEMLLDLSYCAKKWGGDHKFVALTGKMGMREFDRAMKEYNKGNNITITDHGTFITGKGDSLQIDGYFRTVKFMNNIELTVKEFEPYFTEEDLVNIDKYDIYLKLMIDGTASKPFSATTLPPMSEGKQNLKNKEKAVKV